MSGPHYNEVLYMLQNYGASGTEDKRAVQTFIDCETAERVSSLRGQLYSISQGKYDDRTFDAQVGVARRQKHGSYKEWARMCLQWMAGYRG